MCKRIYVICVEVFIKQMIYVEAFIIRKPILPCNLYVIAGNLNLDSKFSIRLGGRGRSRCCGSQISSVLEVTHGIWLN